tara:strand:- start:1266 stop:1622 length:357 start_codon:yes stop_codon:yes gene_type:complete
MLRSVKSTQRKIRQIELILKKSGSDLNASGPASNQVTAADDATGVITITLKQAFAAEVVVIGNSTVDKGVVRVDKTSGKGSSSDKIQIIHQVNQANAALADGFEIHLLIIGSDVDSKI